MIPGVPFHGMSPNEKAVGCMRDLSGGGKWRAVIPQTPKQFARLACPVPARLYSPFPVPEAPTCTSSSIAPASISFLWAD